MEHAEQVIAVDVGSGYLKAVFGGIGKKAKVVQMRSAVGEFTREKEGSFSGQSARGVVGYAGKKWITGDEASSMLDSSELVSSQRDDWAGSPGWVALLLRAIYEAGYREGDVHLVTGVPQRNWSVNFSQMLTSILARSHTFDVDGQEVNINIIADQSMILPQAYGGMAYLINHDEDMREAAAAGAITTGIDVGTFTTGYVALEGMNYRENLSGGVHDVGTWQVARHLVRLLGDTYNYRPRLEKAMEHMYRPAKVFIGGEFVDITPLVRKAAQATVPPLIDVLRSRWQDVSNGMYLVMYGGGAADFYDSIKEAFPNVKLYSGDDISLQIIPVMGMLEFFVERNGLKVKG